MIQTFSNVACTVCGCACDDLTVTIQGKRITEVQRACPLAEPWFATLADPSERPTARISGRPATLTEAIERAADIIRSSHAPLIWGLTRSSTAGHRAAIALAEQIRGTIDTTASCNPAAMLALQNMGQSTCSLGEVRKRADLLIFWNTDPMKTHPRHLERYSVEPRGFFVPNGRRDRTVIVIDSKHTETSRHADTFYEIPAGSDFELASVLRQLLAGKSAPVQGVAGIPLATLQSLVQQLKSCQYGALFFGADSGPEGRATAEVIMNFTSELHNFTRFTAHYLPDFGGLTGAESVLCWQTGYPFAVNFGRGYPRHSPAEYTANSLLERGNVDACVLVGSEGVHQLSPAAQRTLQQLPTISLDYPNTEPALTATVQITTAIYGIHAAGTAYRMDGVPIPLRQLMPSNYPCDDEVLAAISRQLGSACDLRHAPSVIKHQRH
jgi:formylmethanofuran dehydrogenase subunit B